MTTNLNDLAKQIHENAVSKGFWDEPRNTGEIFMLMVSELGEALDADRKNKRCRIRNFEKWMEQTADHNFANNFEVDIKGTFEEEIADVAIRILDYCAFAGINVLPNYEQDLSENIGENLLSATKLIASAHGWVNIGGFDDNVSHCLNESVGLMLKLADAQGFDLIQHIELKMKYNATREHKHGKKY